MASKPFYRKRLSSKRKGKALITSSAEAFLLTSVSSNVQRVEFLFVCLPAPHCVGIKLEPITAPLGPLQLLLRLDNSREHMGSLGGGPMGREGLTSLQLSSGCGDAPLLGRGGLKRGQEA